MTQVEHYKNRPGEIRFSINDREFRAEHDVDGWFWTDLETQISQDAVSSSAAQCQEDSMEWAKVRIRIEREEAEEEEQIRVFGKDVEHWKTHP